MIEHPSATVRQCVHEGPSPSGWRRIAEALDACAADQLPELIRFLDKHVISWPSELRVAPVSWWLAVVSGREEPRFRLARALDLAHGRSGGLSGLRLATALADSAATRQLLHLDLSGTALGDEGARVLVASGRVAQLVTLELADARLGPEAGRAIALSKNLPALVHLGLAGNEDLGAPAVEAILASPRLRMLRELDLSRCRLGDAGARAIASSSGAERLAVLDLSENHLGDRGVAALAASPFLPRLGALHLGRNGIGATGVKALVASTRLKELAVLDLTENDLDDASRALLAGLPFEVRTTDA